MSIGLQLRGLLPSIADERLTLQTIEGWFRRECQALLGDIGLRDEDGVAVLFVELHPAAEAFRLWIENGTEIVASAQTSSVGPGYHIYLCGLLTRMSKEFEIHWKTGGDEGDETDYFESRDENCVYREMLAWLRTVCQSVLQESNAELADLQIAMPTNVVYKADQFLITQMGPRSRKWAEAVTGDSSVGKDFFAWWEPKFDAKYYLGRALCLMWTAVRWRPPLVDEERKTLDEVRANLDLAYELDDTLDYPWGEWSEILECLESDAKVPSRRNGASKSQPPIGYRRNSVQVSVIAGWTIRIPGGFAEAWEDDTWCTWDSALTVWVTAFRSEEDGVKKSAREILADFTPDSSEIVAHETGGILAKASIRWVEEDDQRYWRLRGRSAADGRFCICTICYADSAQAPLALDIWKSLRR
jgi:hypothetical protein